MKKWNSVLEYDSARKVTAGSPEALRDAIRRGADLRIYTGFQHNEHIDVRSSNDDLIQEVSDFPCTYLIDDRWVAAMMTFRQPVQLPGSFGRRASMSFFMYNENGLQSIARPYLDGGVFDASIEDTPILMEKYHTISSFDEDTNAPCSNFVYDFFSYRFLVNDCWEEICSVDENGNVLSGSKRAIEAASLDGCELKVGISGVCGSLGCTVENRSSGGRAVHSSTRCAGGKDCAGEMDRAGGMDCAGGMICAGSGEENRPLRHEVFVQTGPHYFYHKEGNMVAETRPFVRVSPEIPMQYRSSGWDFGWNIVRSDGSVAGLYYDPYTLRPFRTQERHAVRWFAR